VRNIARCGTVHGRPESVFTITGIRTLADLDDAYENSTEFQGYTPSNDISVYGALSDMGADDLEHAFQRALVDMYQFHVIRRERF
jgi:hypothetical protein